MTALGLGLVAHAHAVPGVDDGGLLHDEAVLLEAGDVAPGVGEGDLVDLVGVQPDLALAALEDGRREALLELEGHWCGLERGGWEEEVGGETTEFMSKIATR